MRGNLSSIRGISKAAICNIEKKKSQRRYSILQEIYVESGRQEN
jgi:hypothetical protein